MCSCKGIGATLYVISKTETGKAFLPLILHLILYELFTTVLPLFLALVIQLPSKRNEEELEGFGGWAFIVGVLSFITYFTSDDIAALISLAVLAGIPLVTRKVYGVSWGRAFGTLGLFILFNFIAIFIAELIIDAVLE